MSKKKALGGSTMTLKDFHGGSIPSDLPLPSAPGLVVRPADRDGYDRSVSWGSSTMGRPEIHRGTRPNSSHGGSRHFDDKTPFLNPNVLPIGRNFDEDERKPLDGSLAPRRTISDDSLRSPLLHSEPRSISGLVARGAVTSQVLQVSGRAENSYLGGAGEGVQLGGGAIGVGNVWSARRDAVSVGSSDEKIFATTSAASKLVHASALEKISSGRWQSKAPPHEDHDDVEEVKHVEQERNFVSKGYDDGKYRTRWDYGEGVQVGKNESGNHKVTGDMASMDRKERNSSFQADGKVSHLRVQNPVSSEVLERPKLKLTPRTKPLENSEQTVQEVKQVVSRPVEVNLPETQDVLRNMSTAKHVLLGGEHTNQIFERPKLNLKPRLQPIEPVEPNADVDRGAVFGGARPREMVLKARGIDYVSSENHDTSLTSDRSKSFPKNERVPSNTTTLHGVKAEDDVVDQRTVKKLDDRNDSLRRNWRNDNLRNVKDPDRQQPRQNQQQQQQERRPSPESWRKPLEGPPKPASPESGARFGKAASAVELAQAFSGSLSSSTTAQRSSGQKGLGGQPPVPFSRLTGPARRPQINGY